MAIPLENREGEQVVLEEYTVGGRVGLNGFIRMNFLEVARAWINELYEVTAVSGSDITLADPPVEDPAMPPRLLSDIPTMEYRDIQLDDGTDMGLIVAWDSANYVATVETPGTIAVGNKVRIRERTPLGTPAWAVVNKPTRNQITINTGPDDQRQYALDMLGGVYIDAAEEIISQLVNTLGGTAALADITLTDIASAVQSAGAEGKSIEAFIAERAYQAELDRRAGSLPQ